MRLFLDAHIAGRRVANALRERGHDVRAADEERVLDGMDDADLLALAANDHRILVTFNLKDFLPILRNWAEEGRSHTGCILIASTIKHEHFGVIIAGILRATTDIVDEEAWVDYVHWLSQEDKRNH